VTPPRIPTKKGYIDLEYHSPNPGIFLAIICRSIEIKNITAEAMRNRMFSLFLSSKGPPPYVQNSIH
jgi:hypothetical protein